MVPSQWQTRAETAQLIEEGCKQAGTLNDAAHSGDYLRHVIGAEDSIRGRACMPLTTALLLYISSQAHQTWY